MHWLSSSNYQISQTAFLLPPWVPSPYCKQRHGHLSKISSGGPVPCLKLFSDISSHVGQKPDWLHPQTSDQCCFPTAPLVPPSAWATLHLTHSLPLGLCSGCLLCPDPFLSNLTTVCFLLTSRMYVLKCHCLSKPSLALY